MDSISENLIGPEESVKTSVAEEPAVFVLGAGATRGASFVRKQLGRCVPPLDSDFFTQLQRVRNRKHARLVEEVMTDVTKVFGHNFRVTMETVFATLDHTYRMLDTTGFERAYSKKTIGEMRERLVQAIAVVLEESLTEAEGHSSSRKAKSCEYHKDLVAKFMMRGDTVISFNYDCLIDDSLRRHGDEKWNARHGYCFLLGARGAHLKGDGAWQPTQLAAKERTIKLLKLHGSLNFSIRRLVVQLKQRPYTKQNGRPRFDIIPPEANKDFAGKKPFRRLWQVASSEISRARHLIVIGYSLPATDLHSGALFRTSVRKEALRSLTVVNPDREARFRIREVLTQGVGPSTKVLSFDTLEEFVKSEPSLWRDIRRSDE